MNAGQDLRHKNCKIKFAAKSRQVIFIPNFLTKFNDQIQSFNSFLYLTSLKIIKVYGLNYLYK